MISKSILFTKTLSFSFSTNSNSANVREDFTVCDSSSSKASPNMTRFRFSENGKIESVFLPSKVTMLVIWRL